MFRSLALLALALFVCASLGACFRHRGGISDLRRQRAQERQQRAYEENMHTPPSGCRSTGEGTCRVCSTTRCCDYVHSAYGWTEQGCGPAGPAPGPAPSGGAPPPGTPATY